MAEAPPTGYVSRAAPRSAAEALIASGHTAIRARSKTALEWYLRSFMDRSGSFRSLTGVIDPQALTWITDRSAQEQPDDPRYHTTQLARMYEDVRARVPAVLIVDHSFKWVPTGLSMVSGARVMDGQWVGQFDIAAQVGVTVSCIAHDQDSADALANFICIALNTIRTFTRATRIVPPNCNWEVRVPMTIEASAAQSQPAGDDPTRRIWFSNTDLVLDYEDSMLIATDWTDYDADDLATGGIIAGTIAGPSIACDNTIRAGVRTAFSLRNVSPGQQVRVDRPEVATIDLDDMMITPRRLGEFAIIVTDAAEPSDAGTAMLPKIVASKTVKVVL